MGCCASAAEAKHVEAKKREDKHSNDKEGAKDEKNTSGKVYELDKPEALAQFLQDADIRLVRAEYFLKLLQEKRPLKRRQEAEVPSETCSSLNRGVCSALVPHEEVQEWAQGRQHALIVSISHAWETREHPDPCRFQLQQIWNAVGLYAAANRAVWVFYDYMSLFQFKRQTEAQNESFRRSMNAMHMLYAHDSTHTFRIESLTPQDVWNTMLDESVPVYHEETSAVEPRPLRCLTPNSNPYLQRGWCMAEIEWSSTRSDSSMHQRIGPGSEGAEHPGGRVPMAPDLFREQMHQAVFTHRSDVESVIRLQEKIFFQKVTVCKELTLSWLVPDQVSALAAAIPHYTGLKRLRLLHFKCNNTEADKFGEALARHTTVAELEFLPDDGPTGCAMVKALAEALKQNTCVTTINLKSNKIGDEGAKALAEALKQNTCVTTINLFSNGIGDEGAKALAEALKQNTCVTSINLKWNKIGDEGAKALAEALKQNTCVTTTNLKYNGIGDEGAKALAEAQKQNTFRARW